MKTVHRKKMALAIIFALSQQYWFLIYSSLLKFIKFFFLPRDLIWFSNKTSEDQQGLLGHSVDNKDGFPKAHD